MALIRSRTSCSTKKTLLVEFVLALPEFEFTLIPTEFCALLQCISSTLLYSTTLTVLLDCLEESGRRVLHCTRVFRSVAPGEYCEIM